MRTQFAIVLVIATVTGCPARAPAPAAPRPAGGDIAPAPAVPELGAMAGVMAGTWACTGQGFDAAHGQLVPMTATSTWTISTGGWWLREAFVGKVGDTTHTFDAYTSYDAGAKQWKLVMMQGGGGWSSGTASAASCASGCTIDWDLAVHGAMGDLAYRDHIASPDRQHFQRTGELSMDQGKTWMKATDMTCTRVVGT